MRWRSIWFLPLVVLWFPVAGNSSARGAEKHPHCALFEAIRTRFDGRVGRRIDAVTRLDGIELTCGARRIMIRQSVLVPAARLKADWVERRTATWRAIYCRPGSEYRQAITDGWSISTSIATPDRGEVVIEARCGEAMAALARETAG